MNCAYLAFTAKGLALAQQLAQTCPGSVSRCGLGGVTLAGWTAQQFAAADALVFVGAAGIAVRAIAPHCQSKATDPAVVVLDECGRFAVPLLSGHLGGANDLACRLAAACGAVPVITTATDANGLFAVDEWAKKQNCAVWETPRIKLVSGALLAGKTVRYASPWAIAGTPPAGVAEAEEPSGADFALTMTPQGNALHLIPRIGVLGVGCKRGTTAAQLEAAFAAFCADTNLAPVGITAAASIDLKQNEPGLLEFCRSHGWPVSFYSAAQLRAVPGTFSASRFVQGALVCSGDAGVYGMASPLLELAAEYPDVEVEVVPGLTAALSGAAVLGAPLAHDFCVISLSDRLTPWEMIEKRLACAAMGDFCVALYNPSSKGRPDYLQKAVRILLQNGKGAGTLCGVVRSIGRTGQQSSQMTLAELEHTTVDMFTTVFIGNSATHQVSGWMVTPRGYHGV